MVFVWILLGLLALLALLLFWPLRLHIRCTSDTRVVLRWLFLRYRFYPKGPSKKERAHKPEAAEKKKKPSYFESLKQEHGLAQAITEVCSFVKSLAASILHLLSHIHVRHFLLRVRLGGEDAAQTAMEYGGLCAVLYPTLAFLQSNAHFHRPKTDVQADFEASGSTLYFHTTLSIQAIFLLTGPGLTLLRWVRQKDATQEHAEREGIQGE